MPDSNQSKPRSQSATERVKQVSEHISSEGDSSSTANSGRRRRKAKKDDELPADYSDILGHLTKLREMANTPDHSRRGYVRQKQDGKLWVRERIHQLVDKDSFQEIGEATGHVKWKSLGGEREEPESFTPHNNVQGYGKLNGRRIVFTADDFSIRAGHQDGHLMAKTLHTEKLSIQLKLPMIKLTDGSSGGGSVTSIEKQQFSYVPPMQGFDIVQKQLNMGIPNLGAVLGPAIGLGAARVVSCHFSVMAGNIGSLFNAGPQVVKNATFEEGLSFIDLGGPQMHCTNGTIDNLAADEAECFQQIRTVLGFLPNCGTQVPPVINCTDPIERQNTELRSMIPRRRERMYDPRKIITTVVDVGSWFEIGSLWGQTAIIGLARLGGRPVGIFSNNAEVLTGALDAAGSQKMIRHLKFCDVFNLPLLQFVDAPGYAVGTVAERTATMRWGVELTKAYYTTTMPIFSVIVRKAYGVAGGVIVDCRDPHNRVAWPSGEWGSLPLDGGIDVGHSHELRQIEKEKGREARKARYEELDTMYRRLMNPVRTANHFSIEEIIDPATTRKVVADWLELVYEAELPERVLQRVCGKLQPVYA
ncbi:Putative acetyl-coenzyme A carboxyltransferase, ClpP/crotonase-like domain superfamily [Septoria linicola]|uniref:Acetyl-coenzyme A carboxyltransferase, ClpP/crotonase-like domain superfamily n=1 Tax=Septoria linicola TaxID=215465 RepID=A0A9Q9B3U6_9PEZI|nr:putative acetyl-coenzyme A carboxyltransferase, ClpP/crotonase-like domain superfamily [Septoria linicola]USW55811.1 Putative acetyl-coenzyme A carboxyltransferase, ClpP/crotonase-like domain superfamily [Septoria linicola]